MPDAPRIDEVRLPELLDVDAGALEADEVHEGLRVTGPVAGRLVDAVFLGCAFTSVVLDGADLRGVRVAGARIDGLLASALEAPRSSWRDVVVTGSRVGAASLIGSDWSRVVVRGCRIDFANLAGASLEDVRFEDCTFDELGLAGASASRVALVGCSVGMLDVTGASLADVDLRGCGLRAFTGLPGLRGATVDELQLTALAPLLAAEAGIAIA